MTNEILEHIENRYSCRDFADNGPSKDAIDAILKAGLQAPSAVNRQPWRIVSIEDKHIISDIEDAGIDFLRLQEDQEMYRNVINRPGKLFYNAPYMVIIAIDQNNKEAALLDAGILTQNIVLAAESLGYNTLINGMARTAFQHPKLAQSLRMKLKFPAAYDFAISILIGKAKSTRQAHETDEAKIIRI